MAVNKTPNYDLNKPDYTEMADVPGHFNQNMDTLDAALTPTADPTKTPTGNGPGKIVDWVSWLANRLKAITGKANWWESPTKSLEQLNTGLTSHLADNTTAHGINTLAKKAMGQTFLATLQNDWIGTLEYSKNDLGQVWLRGLLTVGVTTDNTIIAQLPSEYQPVGIVSTNFYRTNYPVDAFNGAIIGASGLLIRGAAATNLQSGDTVRINVIYQA